MNKTQIAEIWDMPSDPQKGEDELRKMLGRAQASRLQIAISGARHSMGGQTIYPGGIAVNVLPFKGMNLDEDKNLLPRASRGKVGQRHSLPRPEGSLSCGGMQSDHSLTMSGLHHRN